MLRKTLSIALLLAGAGLALVLAEERASPLRADRIVVEKSARKLTLYWRSRPVKTYRVALGASPVGPKRCQGDNRTPEGTYRISGRNRHSSFHRSLRVSYPDEGDRRRARELGCKPGGDIMIHGLPNGSGVIGALRRLNDWTLGCIAVTNEEIEEIWQAVPDGTEIEIRP